MYVLDRLLGNTHNLVVDNFPMSASGNQSGFMSVTPARGNAMGMGFIRAARALLFAALTNQLSAPALGMTPTDPQGAGVIVGAMNWLQGTLLGTVATVVAVIAVAAVGFMMLTGRINWRHGAVVVIGCFILFGAASIVAGIRVAAAG